MSFFDEIWSYISGPGGTGDNSLLNDAFYDDKGKLDYAKTAGLIGAIGSSTGLLGSAGTPAPVGYQGTVPDYEATRARVAVVDNVIFLTCNLHLKKLRTAKV